jgi:hypothetical protein
MKNQTSMVLLTINEKSRNNGGQGDLPLGCLPLRGREGVSLQIAIENSQDQKEDNKNDSKSETRLFSIPSYPHCAKHSQKE